MRIVLVRALFQKNTEIFYRKMFRLMSVMGVTFISWVLCGCQSSPIVEFSRINLGQDKSDVLESAGGPSWRDRKNGLDRWTYILFQDGIRLERQVLFSEGIVAYVGDPVEPFISAEEQDRINAQKNLTLERMERQESAATMRSSYSESPITNSQNTTRSSSRSLSDISSGQ